MTSAHKFTDPGRNKTAILTYHRVLDSRVDWRFHDVPIQSFKRQMERVAALHHGKNARSNSVPVIPTFDDGTVDHMRAGEILAELGLRGIFFVASARVGAQNRLSHFDLRRLVVLGHQLGSHTVTHRRLTTLSDNDLHVELTDSRSALEQLIGGSVDWLAPPGGAIDERSLSAALACGYRIVRTMRWGYAPEVLQGEVPSIPIFATTADRRFRHILSGGATFRGYHFKEVVKRLVGHNTYIKLRDRFVPSRFES
jgi:peptidoglycan/xylan/chitin deacetylase (PgdA/CDA1 family)